MGVFKNLKELIKGMGITGKHLGRHAITIQYPEEKWTMPEGSRGVVVLLSDKKTGELNCTGCGLCEKACPTGAIDLDAPRGEDKKRVLKKFVVDNALCCFCGLCEESCNFCAIKMDTRYEMSVLDKKELIWDMGKLQEMGKDVDYVDTRKKKKPKVAKKPVVKPTEDAKPEAAAVNPGDAKPAAEAAPDKEPEAPKSPDKPAEGDDKKTESGGEN
ncbi:MAG: 4Fe-4S dicluster domain-containing protein [bacterium]|nr:4Fe-4S dicluster domain-containing protein [bacterium]